MEFIPYFSTAVIAFLGLVSGILLSYIAKEELKPGRKYFLFAQNIILGAIFILFFMFYDLNIWLMASIVIFLTLIYMFVHDYEIREVIMYPVLGVTLFMTSFDRQVYSLTATLIFLYGLPTASYLLYLKEKPGEIIVRHLSFLVVIVMLFFI